MRRYVTLIWSCLTPVLVGVFLYYLMFEHSSQRVIGDSLRSSPASVSHNNVKADGNNSTANTSSIRVRPDPIELFSLGADSTLVDLVELKRCLLRMAPSWSTFKIYKLTHALELWGRHVDFPKDLFIQYYSNTTPGTDDLVNTLLDEEYHQRLSPGETPLLFRIDNGIAVRTSVSQVGTEGGIFHTDAYLSILSECGVTPSTPVRLGNGDVDVLETIIRTSATDLADDQEFEWTLNALVRYFPPWTSEWRDRRGRNVSLDDLANKLLDRKQGVGTCYGLHVPYSLAVAYRVDKAHGILKESTRERIHQYFISALAAMEASRTPRGSCHRSLQNGLLCIRPFRVR